MNSDVWIRTIDKAEYFCRLRVDGESEWVRCENREQACLISVKEVDKWIELLHELTGKQLEAIDIADNRPDDMRHNSQTTGNHTPQMEGECSEII